jgi:hypothetical protein
MLMNPPLLSCEVMVFQHSSHSFFVCISYYGPFHHMLDGFHSFILHHMAIVLPKTHVWCASRLQKHTTIIVNTNWSYVYTMKSKLVHTLDLWTTLPATKHTKALQITQAYVFCLCTTILNTHIGKQIATNKHETSSNDQWDPRSQTCV